MRKQIIALCAFCILTWPLTGQDLSAVDTWQPDDWWTVEFSQRPSWVMTKDTQWVSAGRWKFTVDNISDEAIYTVRVNDLDRPKEAGKWELALAYNRDGQLTEIVYTTGKKTFRNEDALRYLPVSKDAFEIRHPAERLRAAPLEARTDVLENVQMNLLRLDLEEEKAAQWWLQEEPWWRYYEEEGKLNVKGTLISSSKW